MTVPTLQRNAEYWLAAWKETTGKRRFQSLGRRDSMTKRQAEAALAEVIKQHAMNPAMRDMAKAPSLGDFIEHYFASRHDLDDSTIELQRSTTARMLDFWESNVRLDSINRLQASAFRTWLTKYTYTRSPAKGATRYTLSPASVRRHVATAKQIMQWAASRDIIPINPFDREKVGSPPAQEQWQYVDDAAFQKVLDACPSEAWRRAFSLARRAGLRLNEIVRAEWSWIDWQARTLAVVPKLRNGRRQASTKQSFRTVPLSPDLYKLLLDGFTDADAGLICPHLGSSPSHAADKIIAKAKLGWSKPMHTLRKSLETDWLEAHPLPDVCKWLGHDPAIAIKVYHKTKQGRIDAVTGQGGQVSSDATQSQEVP